VLVLASTALGGGVGTAGAAKGLTASMNGASEVPRGDRDGRGTARVTTDRSRGLVCYRISLSRVGTVTAGHIHRGAAGKAGPIVVSFFAKPTRRPSGCVTGVSRSLIRDVERNPRRFYVNVHNPRHPAGAVRCAASCAERRRAAVPRGAGSRRRVLDLDGAILSPAQVVWTVVR